VPDVELVTIIGGVSIVGTGTHRESPSVNSFTPSTEGDNI